MSSIIEQILSRRSIRKYTAEPVPREILEQILQAGMAAPSANNRKPWEFMVLTESASVAAVTQRLILGRYTPQAIIIPCGNLLRSLPWPAASFWVQDCSAAMQNMWLAAKSLGLGGVWVGIHPLKPFERSVQKALGLPRTVIPLGALYLGYPDETKEPRSQYEAARVHWQKW
ncbi:MAG: nitroreductase family protein [Anaerolineae bacterium]